MRQASNHFTGSGKEVFEKIERDKNGLGFLQSNNKPSNIFYTLQEWFVINTEKLFRTQKNWQMMILKREIDSQKSGVKSRRQWG